MHMIHFGSTWEARIAYMQSFPMILPKVVARAANKQTVQYNSLNVGIYVFVGLH